MRGGFSQSRDGLIIVALCNHIAGWISHEDHHAEIAVDVLFHLVYNAAVSGLCLRGTENILHIAAKGIIWLCGGAQIINKGAALCVNVHVQANTCLLIQCICHVADARTKLGIIGIQISLQRCKLLCCGAVSSTGRTGWCIGAARCGIQHGSLIECQLDDGGAVCIYIASHNSWVHCICQSLDLVDQRAVSCLLILQLAAHIIQLTLCRILHGVESVNINHAVALCCNVQRRTGTLQAGLEDIDLRLYVAAIQIILHTGAGVVLCIAGVIIADFGPPSSKS